MTDTNPRDLIERLAYELDAETGYTNHRTGERITHIDVAEARAYLAQPEPEELTEEEIEKRFQRWWFDEGSGMRPSNGEDHEAHVRRISQIAWSNGAYVARWGRFAVEPVPASERLPGEGDCDSEGRCWLASVDVEPGWVADNPEQCTNWTHWLPHYALPVPATTETP